MADEERIAQLQEALDNLLEPIPVSDKEAELSDDASMASATASYEKALESYNESKERLEGKIEAEKAIEDLSPPEQEEEE